MAYYITDKCIGCSICEIKCPTDTIVGESKQVFEIIPEGCIDCGTCGIWCPVDAIQDNTGRFVKGLKPRNVPKAKVDENACIACEYCVDACPFDCITMEPHPDGQFTQLAVVDEKKCVGCRLCEESCLWEAIYMEGDRLTSLSQSPIKGSFLQKILPSQATVAGRDDAKMIRKEYVKEKKEEKPDHTATPQ